MEGTTLFPNLATNLKWPKYDRNVTLLAFPGIDGTSDIAKLLLPEPGKVWTLSK